MFLFHFNVAFLFLFKKYNNYKYDAFLVCKLLLVLFFDLYHSHGYIITFSTFRSSVFTNGRFLFFVCLGHRNSVRLSVCRPSVRHTGGSVKKGAS